MCGVRQDTEFHIHPYEYCFFTSITQWNNTKQRGMGYESTNMPSFSLSSLQRILQLSSTHSRTLLFEELDSTAFTSKGLDRD